MTMFQARTRSITVAAVLLATTVLAWTPRPADAAPSSDERAIADELSTFVNRERNERGLSRLDIEAYAVGTAQEWAEHQRNSAAVQHRADMASRYGAYPAYGENVGTTMHGTGDIHRLFMSSGTHRRNILQPGFDAMGIGVACAADGRMYVTVDFVARSQHVANRYSTTSVASTPVAVGEGGRTCPRPAAPGTTVGAPGTGGYWLQARDGGIFAFGDVAFHGSMGGQPLNRPVVGIAATPRRDGYWMVASDGGMFSFGSARFMGSMGGQSLNQPVIAMAARPQGDGYWLVAADGGMFSFGAAPFRGSMGGQRINRPIVGMAATASGNGYWQVASDGGIFAFGDAPYLGSMGGQPLNRPIVGMAATASGRGYWLVASDGGIFAFGDARFFGSTGGHRLNSPIIGMARSLSGNGYWLTAADGGVFAYGDAGYRGSTGGMRLNQPIVAAAA
ncbi:MAG: CAP domain-containing protein [Actinobacteria bacterium]|nr:CAP domain-containing protein [Actinomycetota bacterium]